MHTSAESRSGNNTEVFTWTFPGAPVSVQLDIETVARLAQLTAVPESDDSRTIEHGGVLLGRTYPGGTIEMTDCEPAVAGDEGLHQAIGGLRQRLSVGLEQAEGSPRVVGYYRTLSSGRMALEKPDLEILETSFPSKSDVVLLVKPEKKGPATAGFFFRDGDEVYSDYCFLEFPLDAASLPARRLLRAISAVEPSEERNPPAPPALSVVPRRTVAAPRKSWWLIAGIAVAAALSIVVFLPGRPGSHQPPEIQRSPSQTSLELGKPIRPDLQAANSSPETSVPTTVLPPRSSGVPANSAPDPKPDPAADPPRTASVDSPPADGPVPVAPSAAEVTVSTALPGARKVELAQPDPPPAASPSMILAQVKEPLPGPAPVVVPVEVPQAPPQPPVIPRPQAHGPTIAPADKPGRPVVVIEPQPIRQAQPSVPQSALLMLSKEIVVVVQLRIDASGNVVGATYKPPGGIFGKYFAERAVAAARLWKFEPARVGTQNVPSDKVLEFRFSPQPH